MISGVFFKRKTKKNQYKFGEANFFVFLRFFCDFYAIFCPSPPGTPPRRPVGNHYKEGFLASPHPTKLKTKTERTHPHSNSNSPPLERPWSTPTCRRIWWFLWSIPSTGPSPKAWFPKAFPARGGHFSNWPQIVIFVARQQQSKNHRKAIRLIFKVKNN